jgi:hypothetical protein
VSLITALCDVRHSEKVWVDLAMEPLGLVFKIRCPDFSMSLL